MIRIDYWGFGTMTDARKLLLLGLLRQTDMHGYLLNAHLDGAIPITLKKPTSYHLLEIMETDGWVIHREEHSGKRARKVYSLTRNGEAAFLDLLKRQLAAFTPTEYPGLVSMGFLDALPAGEVRERLEIRRAKIRDSLASLHPETDNHLDTDPHHPGSLHLAMRYFHRAMALELEFLGEVIHNLEDQ